MRSSTLWRGALVSCLVLVSQALVSGPARAAGDGTVLSWGYDNSGQLGDDAPLVNKFAPVPVANGVGTLNGVVAVSAGGNHSLALRPDGSVLAWGSDFYGQLGDDVVILDKPTPVPVLGLGAGSGVVAIAAGGEHSLALRSDGSVLAWGGDYTGQLGDGGLDDNRLTPVPVFGLGAGSGVVAIAAGGNHSMALRANGSVVAWGSNFYGQVGNGSTHFESTVPVAVSGLGVGSGIVAVAGGGNHSLAVREDGTVFAWGSDNNGQLGDDITFATNRNVPVEVSGLGTGSGVAAVAAGGSHSLALLSNGTVLSWGADFNGQLGDGFPNADQAVPVPSVLGVGSGIIGLSAGGNHSVAVRDDGSVSAWGRDAFGQLGNGLPNTDQPTPVPVSGIGPGSGVAAVSAGGSHSLALKTPGPTFAPIAPARVWDSRFGPGPIGRIGSGGVRNVAVTGIGGVPSTGVTAIVVNVTAVNPSFGTFITVWPTGEPRPLASNINIPAGDTRPNLVTVKVGALGKVSFYNDAGTTDLVADVAGWYGPFGRQRYTALTPARIWDSRPGPGPGPAGALGPATTRAITVTGVGGVPASATAVVFNLTAVSASPTVGTFITVWPFDDPQPLASNVNIPPGDTRANLVTVKVGVGGKVNFYNDTGFVNLIADVAGYFGPTGASLNSVSPSRIYDSRFGPGPQGRLGIAGIQTVDVNVTGIGGVPTSGVTAVILNVTAVNPSAGTFVTVWPAGETQPPTSNINIPPGDTRANLVVVKVGAFGQVSFNNNAGTVDLIADVAGWYGTPGT